MMGNATKSGGRGTSPTGLSLERFAMSSRADFRFAPLNALVLVAVFVAGLTVHVNVYGFSLEAVLLSVGSALGLAILLRLTQVWASEHYRGNEVALHLRAMNMGYEGLRQKGSMVIVPSTAVETMGLGALGGLTSFGRDVVPPEPEGAREEAPSDDAGT